MAQKQQRERNKKKREMKISKMLKCTTGLNKATESKVKAFLCFSLSHSLCLWNTLPIQVLVLIILSDNNFYHLLAVQNNKMLDWRFSLLLSTNTCRKNVSYISTVCLKNSASLQVAKERKFYQEIRQKTTTSYMNMPYFFLPVCPSPESLYIVTITINFAVSLYPLK